MREMMSITNGFTSNILLSDRMTTEAFVCNIYTIDASSFPFRFSYMHSYILRWFSFHEFCFLLERYSWLYREKMLLVEFSYFRYKRYIALNFLIRHVYKVRKLH